MRGPWDVGGDCTPRCAVHAVPRTTAATSLLRAAAFAGVVRRALTDGPRMADPARLRAHARALLTAVGVGLEGTPPPLRVAAGTDPGGATRAPGTLIVVNHVSWLDIPALLAIEPVTVLAKREIGGWPVVGGLARRAGTHFIDRGSPRQLPHTVRDLADLLASGRSVAVFPQATTWCTADRGTFRRATFQAAVDAGAPVRPVTLDYAQSGRPTTVAAFCGQDTFAASLRRVLTARGLTLRVTAHPPLLPGRRGPENRRSLAAVAQLAVLGERHGGCDAHGGKSVHGGRSGHGRRSGHGVVALGRQTLGTYL